MKKMKYEEFREKIISLPDDESIWRLKCRQSKDKFYSLAFSKHLFEAENGAMYPFVIYSYPMTLNAGLIQEDVDDGWEPDIKDAWSDILNCGLTPMKD